MTPSTARTVAVTGSTGLLGRPLLRALESAGYRVVRVARPSTRTPGGGRAGPGEARDADVGATVLWDPERGTIERDRLEGVHAVVHLAGESIAGLRWTLAKKRRILDSREKGTRLLAGAFAGLGAPPSVLVSGSAVGYYGDRGDEPLTEESLPGTGFLASVCARWEEATEAARAAGIRTVRIRTGQVLSPAGGLLGAILLPFRLGLGGRLGSGRQYMAWIDLDDFVGLVLHAIATPTLEGPLNATAPRPVANAEFTGTLAKVLRRPAAIPVPGLALRALLGEMGRELMLSGQRALPERALASGYQFRFADLEASLRHQLRGEGRGKEPL